LGDLLKSNSSIVIFKNPRYPKCLLVIQKLSQEALPLSKPTRILFSLRTFISPYLSRFSNERLVGVRQQLPAEDAEPGRHSHSSRLINVGILWIFPSEFLRINQINFQ